MNSSYHRLALTFRVVFLLVFSLYWGGLTFYTGFVVRVSHDVLNDPMDGGLITQRVTALLQYLGVAAVALMAFNTAFVMRQNRKYGAALLGTTLALGVSLIGLFLVHGHLDAVIHIQASEIIDRDAFTIGHRRYNQLTTVEWIAAITHLAVTTFAWHTIDGLKQRERGNDDPQKGRTLQRDQIVGPHRD